MAESATERSLQSPDDVAAVVSELTEGQTYAELVQRHGDISTSFGAWHGWRTGKRTPNLGHLLALAKAHGAEVVVRIPGEDR